MPTYEYECLSCGHRFEVFQSITDEPVKKCPECKKGDVRRLIGTGMGIIFKGSGFYETDYKRKSATNTGSSKPSDTSNGSNNSQSSSSDSGKTEGKGSF